MYIYKTTCLINGKIYIGQCSKTPEDSKSYLGSGSNIGLAIKKHGRENFVKEILRRDIVDITSLDRWEEIYIKKYQACNEAIGYNILPGTANGFGKINPIRLPGVVEKATQWLKDCRDNNLIAKRPNRKYTEESKSEIGEKMRNVNIGRMHITNGIEDKFVIKVKKKDIPEGWWKGRSLTRGKPKKEIYVKKTLGTDID